MARQGRAPHNASHLELIRRLSERNADTTMREALRVDPYPTALAIGTSTLQENRKKLETSFVASGNETYVQAHAVMNALFDRYAISHPHEISVVDRFSIPGAYKTLAQIAFNLMRQTPEAIFSDEEAMYFLKRDGNRRQLIRTANPPIGVDYSLIFDGSNGSLFWDIVSDLAHYVVNIQGQSIEAEDNVICEAGRRMQHFGQCLLGITWQDGDFVLHEDPWQD